MLPTRPPGTSTWLPYLGETLDAGVATLLAEEAILGLRFVYGLEPQIMPGIELTGTSAPSDRGYLNGPIDDIQLRSWGIQLVDGRMPGFAAIIGAARTNQAAVEIVRQHSAHQLPRVATDARPLADGRGVINTYAHGLHPGTPQILQTEQGEQ